MNLKEFFASLNGQFIDVDGAGSAANKNQCVDVVKAYCSRVFGISVSSMSGYGDAWEYYDNFSEKKAITPYFNRIAYKKGMAIKAGDIIVWDRSINKSNAGHISVASGKYSASEFESFDQNFPSGSPCIYVMHSYNKVKGILRPKDFSKVTGEEPLQGTGSYPKKVRWENGSTKEIVYKDSSMENELNVLNPRAGAYCYSKSGSAYLIVYTVNGGKHATAGFVEYAGGVAKAPPESKTYRNGSSSETVYADVDKTIRVGSLDPYETCYCLGRINGMYLVLYNVTGTSTQKCGFVDYNGGLE